MTASEVFTSDLTLRAGLVAAAAIAVLILVSNNKPERARLWIPVNRRRPAQPVRVERYPVPLYRGPRWWERIAAATGLTVISGVVAAIVATVIAGLLILAVTTLTGKLS